MTGRGGMVRRFGERERERLGKLFRQLGTDNVYEAEASRSRVASLLETFNKTWGDVIALLSDGALDAGIAVASDIAGLGDSDPDRRATARRNIFKLLERHRKSWNDFIDALSGVMSAAWLHPSATPDPDRVNPLDLLTYILPNYIELRGPHECTAVALWAMHTHIYTQYLVTPRMALRSAVAGCGKTTLIDVLSRLVARPAKFDSITTSAIYRSIDATHPTLFIDEADNLGLSLRPSGRLRAIFNSGHRSGGQIAITEAGETRVFSTHCPLMVSLPDAVQGLPRTLNSRCITLTMQRTDGRRKLERLDANRSDPVLDAAYQQILLWRRDVELNPDPEMPASMHNRLADNWRPLLAIADSLDWGKRAREAMLCFAREFQDADARILLLTDIRRLFDAKGVDRLPSKVLLDALHGLDDTEWTEFTGIRGEQQPHKVKAGELASMLRDFWIRPQTIWPMRRTPTSKSARGYRRQQFEEAWRIYCSGDTPTQRGNLKRLHLATDNTA